MIEITLSSGTKIKGEVVKQRFNWIPFDAKGICLEVMETVTKIETYKEPKSEKEKTRQVTTEEKVEIFLKKDFIAYVKRVK